VAIFGKVVGGCGHTFVQDAGTESFEMELVTVFLFFLLVLFMCAEGMFTYVQMFFQGIFTAHLSVAVCVLAAERTQGGKSNAVAMESYPWCRNYGNKAWKACDLIGISESLWSCEPE